MKKWLCWMLLGHNFSTIDTWDPTHGILPQDRIEKCTRCSYTRWIHPTSAGDITWEVRNIGHDA
jgi:hypothetical protein